MPTRLTLNTFLPFFQARNLYLHRFVINSKGMAESFGADAGSNCVEQVELTLYCKKEYHFEGKKVST